MTAVEIHLWQPLVPGPWARRKWTIPDLLKFKYQYLRSLQGKGEGDGSRGKIGIPFGLNMYENLPFLVHPVHHFEL